MDIKEFSLRLSKLRINKGDSARGMSKALGLSESYINNIETCQNLPSMEVFFYICEYFGITESEFFDTESTDPVRTRALLEATKGLSVEQLDHLTAIAKDMRK